MEGECGDASRQSVDGCKVAQNWDRQCNTALVEVGMQPLQAVYPLDVIRRRMQVQSGSEYRGFLAMLRTLSARELFYGLSATYLKVMPSAAISLLVRDVILGRLQK